MNFIFVDKATLLLFIAKYWRGKHTKDYELVASYLLCSFCEKQWRAECAIGFKLKSKYDRDIPNYSTASIEKIAEMLRKMVDEDTPIDVTIVKKPINQNKNYGPAFQLKRFGVNPRSKGTEAFMEQLKAYNKKYARSNTILVVLVERGAELNLRSIRDTYPWQSFPFSKLMVVWAANDKVNIAEIWPKSGMEEMGLEDFK